MSGCDTCIRSNRCDDCSDCDNCVDCDGCTSHTRHDATGELASPVKRMNGTVIYTGRVARVGIHHYPWGMARRDAEELKNLTMQLPGKPVVIHHPSRKSGGKFKGGDRKKVGRIDSAQVEGDFAIAKIIVEDAMAINEITRGVRELSLGYDTDIVEGWDRNGRVDHLAFVPAARCGPECAIRLDSETRSEGGDAFKVQSMLRILKK